MTDRSQSQRGKSNSRSWWKVLVAYSDDELLARADETIKFYQADPQGIGTAKPCECAQRAIDNGYMVLNPDCEANRCKELRR